MSDNNDSGSNFFRGLMTGALVGAVAVWFLNQTEKGKDVLGNLNDLVQDLEEKGKEFKKKVIQVKEEFEEKAKDFRQDIIEESKVGLERIEELEEKGHKAAQKFFTRQGKPLS